MTKKEAWVIGDVHGCAAELRALLKRIDAFGPSRIYMVGDLYTKGPDPVGVWKLIRDRKLKPVLGNHDVRMLAFLDGERDRDEHARRVARALDRADRDWREHLRGLPMFREKRGWTIVHASVHPSGDLRRTTRKDLVARRRFPLDRAPDPFWWSVYEGDRRVVFGHDAARGLIQVHRDGQLVLAGLDTGCVYGGRLTAIRLSDGHLEQVRAARVYERVVRRPAQ